MYRFPSATRATEASICRLPAIVGTWREGHQTSKTSKEHATAVVDDMPARTENRPQEPRHPAT